MEKKKNDLRVIRTKGAIRKAFHDMIIETQYSDITVKALTERAMINRNTFYLHYGSLDELWEELQDEMAKKFLSMYVSYDSIEDVEEMVRRFFEYVTSVSPLQERILCSPGYQPVAERIHEKIAAQLRQTRRGALGMSDAAEDIVFDYLGSVGIAILCRWIACGKKLPVDELIELSTKLICHGMESVICREGE